MQVHMQTEDVSVGKLQNVLGYEATRIGIKDKKYPRCCQAAM